MLELRQSYWRANAQKRQPVNSLRWPIYVFNSDDNNKLPRKNSGLGEMTRENEPLTLDTTPDDRLNQTLQIIHLQTTDWFIQKQIKQKTSGHIAWTEACQ